MKKASTIGDTGYLERKKKCSEAILPVNWLIGGFSLLFLYFTVFNFVVIFFAQNDMHRFDCEKTVFKK